MENVQKINAIPIKAISCDNIAAHVIHSQPTVTKRANFPYAFIRSRLSVLPEEKRGSIKIRKPIKNDTENGDFVNKQNDIGYKQNSKINKNFKLNESMTFFSHIKRIRLIRDSGLQCVGIKLTQHFYSTNDNNTIYRYLITDMKSNGIACKDGRLRIGDEIVNVNGQDLRDIQSFDSILEMIETFINNCVELVIAYDEELSTKVSTSNSFNSNNNISCNNHSTVTVDTDHGDKMANDIKYLLRQRKQCDFNRSRNNRFQPFLYCSNYVPVYKNHRITTDTLNNNDNRCENTNYFMQTKLNNFQQNYRNADNLCFHETKNNIRSNENHMNNSVEILPVNNEINSGHTETIDKSPINQDNGLSIKSFAHIGRKSYPPVYALFSFI